MFKRLLVVAGLLVTMLLPLMAAPVGAVELYAPCDDPINKDTAVCQNTDNNAGETVKDLINVLLFIIGILAVIVIIVAGVMYVVSGGDQATVTRAKNTILYAVIGLVVALAAYAIVNWVILRVT